MFCYNCGKTFPESEIVQRRDGETALHIYCCPHCGANDIAESETCEICGEEHLEGEIYDGICLDCAWNSIDYKIALQFMEDTDCLHDFILTDWFEGGTIDGTSDKLREFLRETFLRQQADDLLCARTDFLDRCKEFCMPYYRDRIKRFGPEGMEFVDWLNKWRKKNANV